jgi:hypothetical protein
LKRAAWLALLLALAACGPEDPALSLVARREGEHGYLIWGRTRVREALELSVEDGDRVLFGPVPLLVRDGRFRADIAVSPGRAAFLNVATADGAREWRVGLPRWRREVRIGPRLPPDPPPLENAPTDDRIPPIRD